MSSKFKFHSAETVMILICDICNKCVLSAACFIDRDTFAQVIALQSKNCTFRVCSVYPVSERVHSNCQSPARVRPVLTCLKLLPLQAITEIKFVFQVI